MLSVLIPVFNFDIRKLVRDIHFQSLVSRIPFEILVFDDGSDSFYKDKNREITLLTNVIYNEEPINLGRSKIRNKLAKSAKYENLIFLDCDSQLTNRNFIENYKPYLDKEMVVYGGRSYIKYPPKSQKLRLHWQHGIYREEVSADKRMVVPNRSFMTNNFMVHRSIFNKICFDEKNINGYGHEDTLFGFELKKYSINITHIDNPVYHIGLEASEEFLRKTREGIKNLKKIMKINGNEKRLIQDITLLSYYKKIEKMGLSNTVLYFYKRYEHLLRKNLLSEHPNLFVFDLYKLGYLCSLGGER